VTRRENPLQRRGVLIRRLLRYREMLPGSLVFTQTRCGKATCICAQGKQLHPVCQLVTRVDGRTRTIFIPPRLVDWVKERSALYRALRADLAEIGRINIEVLAEKKREPRLREKGGPRIRP